MIFKSIVYSKTDLSIQYNMCGVKLKIDFLLDREALENVILLFHVVCVTSFPVNYFETIIPGYLTNSQSKMYKKIYMRPNVLKSAASLISFIDISETYRENQNYYFFI
jgi:hypothetical protein